MRRQDFVLISAPNVPGERFMKLLRQRNVPFAAIVNNPAEYERVRELGAAHIIVVNTNKEQSWLVPPIDIGSVYLFETSVTLCCRYVQICRGWTSRAIYVITGSDNPRNVYRTLGVDYVIHSRAQDYGFLITDDLLAK